MRYWSDTTARPVARPLFDYVAKNKRWSGTPDELLELLRSSLPSDQWWKLPADLDELVAALTYLRRHFIRLRVGYQPKTFSAGDVITIYLMSPDNSRRVRKKNAEYKRWQRSGAVGPR